MPTCQVPPLRIQICLIGEATLHDVLTEVWTRLSKWHAVTVRTVRHLHHGAHTFSAQRNLRKKEKERDVNISKSIIKTVKWFCGFVNDIQITLLFKLTFCNQLIQEFHIFIGIYNKIMKILFHECLCYFLSFGLWMWAGIEIIGFYYPWCLTTQTDTLASLMSSMAKT